VDVRTAPGSRRNPQFNRADMGLWLPEAGISYRWEPRLGGFRRPRDGSPNLALAHPSFRGYADYMLTEEFRSALGQVLEDARREPTAVMCAETLWWRCHRRLIADAATLAFEADVAHLAPGGKRGPHRLTEGARLAADGQVIYDVATTVKLEVQ